MYNLVEFIIHFDRHLREIVDSYGGYAYLILFLIIFFETGVVVAPFLPGDSLLFIAGTFSSQGFFNIYLLFVLLFIAAVIGDSVNYYIGRVFGERAFRGNRLFRREYLERTNDFYDKHGGKMIILARFIPIIRTFAPFVAGIAKMDYKKFIVYNIVGAFAWVGIFLFAGYFFGNIQFVRENLTLIVLLIVIVSVIPPAINYIRGLFSRLKK